jgi:hypothetical protein
MITTLHSPSVPASHWPCTWLKPQLGQAVTSRHAWQILARTALSQPEGTRDCPGRELQKEGQPLELDVSKHPVLHGEAWLGSPVVPWLVTVATPRD